MHNDLARYEGNILSRCTSPSFDVFGLLVSAKLINDMNSGDAQVPSTLCFFGTKSFQELPSIRLLFTFRSASCVKVDTSKLYDTYTD